MGGSTGKAVDTVSKKTAQAFGQDSGTNIQAQAEETATTSGLQNEMDQAGENITDAYQSSDIGKGLMHIQTQVGNLMNPATDSLGDLAGSASKAMNQRQGLAELGQNARQQKKGGLNRSGTSRTLLTKGMA